MTEVVLTQTAKLSASVVKRIKPLLAQTPTPKITISPTITLTTEQVAALKAQLATPPVPPPKPKPPMPTNERIQASYDATDAIYASRYLHAAWQQANGDWLDRNGVLNGPAATVTQAITAAPISIDISAIAGDLHMRWDGGAVEGIWDNVRIDGAPAVTFWLDPSAPPQPMPGKWSAPSIILNPARGRTLTFVSASIGATVSIDKVAGPLIPADLPMIAGGTGVADVASLELVNEAAIQAACVVAPPFAFNPEFGVEPSGLKYLRFSSVDAERLISWWLTFAPREEAWLSYCLFIENDVAAGFNEGGIKLPGLAGRQDETGPEVLSWRMFHGQNDPANLHLYAPMDYLYSADLPTIDSYPPIRTMGNSLFRAGRWCVIEQHAKLNTPGQPNGIAEVFINGNLVWSRTDMKFRNNAVTKLETVHINVYHGGQGRYPNPPIHYRIAKIRVGSVRVGVPAELLASVPPVKPQLPPPVEPPPPVVDQPPIAGFPAWRQGRAVGSIATIPGTSPSLIDSTTGSGIVPADMIDGWCGLGAGPDYWVSAAASGHEGAAFLNPDGSMGGGNNNGWQNGVFRLALNVAAPRWEILDAGSTYADSHAAASLGTPYYRDSRPAGRHTYFDTQVLERRNRVALVGSYAAAWMEAPADPRYGGGPEFATFDLTARRWDAPLACPDVPFYIPVPKTVCRDPRNDNLYVASQGQFQKWTNATNTWSAFDPVGMPANKSDYAWMGSCIDVSRNRWVHIWQVADTDTPHLQFLDLATGAYSEVQISGIPTLWGYTGITHDRDNDRYVIVGWVPGATVPLYAIHPVTGAATRIADVPAPINCPQERLHYFPALGGIAYLPSFASDVLFLATR